MPPARLSDDGRTVTLDLHGVRVDEALGLVRRTAARAASRGRTALRVVHGASTSDPLARNRTIRHALHDALDAGDVPSVVDAVRLEGATLLALAAAARPDPARLRLPDVS